MDRFLKIFGIKAPKKISNGQLAELMQSCIDCPERFIETLLKDHLKNTTDAQKAAFLLKTGKNLSILAHYRHAVAAWQIAIEYFVKDRDKYGQAQAYNNLGIPYNFLGDYLKAINCFKEALRLNEEIEDPELEAGCYVNMGISYAEMGRIDESIELTEKALNIYDQVFDIEGQISCYLSLGTAYDGKGEFEIGIEYFHKALELARQYGDPYSESACLSDLGTAYNIAGKYEKALKFHKKALEMKVNTADRMGQAVCYTGLGDSYNGLEQFEKALENYLKSVAICREIEAVPQLVVNLMSMAGIHYGREEYDKTLKLCNTTLKHIKGKNDDETRAYCFQLMGDTYDEKGDREKAEKYYKKSERYKNGKEGA